MSNFDYSRFVKMGNRMLTRYGDATTLTIYSQQANADKPWEESITVPTVYSGLQSVKFDPIKTLDSKGNILKSDATFYISMNNTKGLLDIPFQSVIAQQSEPDKLWTVVKCELIKPAEVGCLWIIWVEKYAGNNG